MATRKKGEGGEGAKLPTPCQAASWGGSASALLSGVAAPDVWRADPVTGRIEAAGLELYGPCGLGELLLAAEAPLMASRLAALADAYAKVWSLAAKEGVDLGQA